MAFRTLAIIAAGVLLDQLTKWVAFNALQTERIVIIPKILDFVLVFNHGAAWGIFSNQRLFLSVVSIAVLVFIMIYWKSLTNTAFRYAATVSLSIGALGNLIDRIRLGYVIDFINIQLIPVFNVADICINIAALCYIVDYIQHRHD